MTAQAPTDGTGASALRWALIGLAVAGTGGASTDLVVARHWSRPIQIVPWVSVAVLSFAIAVLVLRPGRRSIWVVRGLALLVAVSGAFGVYQHVAANQATGMLDFRYADTWAGMSVLAHWWTAATGGVGSAPPLAPGVLAYAAVTVMFATVHHPAATHRLVFRAVRNGRIVGLSKTEATLNGLVIDLREAPAGAHVRSGGDGAHREGVGAPGEDLSS